MQKILACAGLLIAFSASAADLHPVLYMDNMVQVKSTETYGDELYLVVTEFNSENKNKQYTIPNYPVHWPTDALPKIKNLKVWDGVLTEDEAVELIVELVEHDAPPFDVDDSIGSLKIKLTNKKGELDVSWLDDESATHTPIQVEKNAGERYTFTGEGGNYHADFYFKKEATAAPTSGNSVTTVTTTKANASKK